MGFAVLCENGGVGIVVRQNVYENRSTMKMTFRVCSGQITSKIEWSGQMSGESKCSG